MKRKNIVTYTVKNILLLIIFLSFNSNEGFTQIGASCPPCTMEQAELNYALTELTTARNNLASARSSERAARNTASGLAFALSGASAAAAAACGGPQALTPPCWAALAAVVAAEVALTYALLECHRCLDELNEAIEALLPAQDNYNNKFLKLKECTQRPTEPCQKCVAGRVVADDSQNPGPCKECSNGEIVDIICPSGQQCCNSECVDIQYYYVVTITTITCDGSNDYSYETESEPSNCGQTGELEYSLGVCVGGSIVIKTCSGPYPIPCE